MKPIRVYADTSVFGGAFDDEFAAASREFFDQVRQGNFQLVSSALVRDELGAAPSHVLRFFEELTESGELSEIRQDAIKLQTAYLNAGILGEASVADALHVAMATVLECRIIVSWNFRHIVHFQKIPLYNEVNVTRGYAKIAIHAPTEVVAYED
ncbi:MAG: type II toxin-antitoxin system VapC family toxin [Candidatus Hydrogenedentes bacterium]|nr:type II toxin-antitoxin system VapC family toxin [Candidatus Hydrogenedentota bacterium]